ncbi:MAG: nucleoside 2-deoxyribosyltransferase [Aggregatilineales bacterium]
MPKIYIAGPLFNSHERRYLEEIAETFETSGYPTFLPHRDAGLVDRLDETTRRTIFLADLKALDECDICIALLTGADHDSGTSVELGYMYAKGKPCFGITDDMRWMNNMIWGVCGYGRNIASTIGECIKLVNQFVNQGLV